MGCVFYPPPPTPSDSICLQITFHRQVVSYSAMNAFTDEVCLCFFCCCCRFCLFKSQFPHSFEIKYRESQSVLPFPSAVSQALSTDTTPLCPVSFVENSDIPDQRDAIQIAFAAPHVGGSVFKDGCAQEDVMLMLHPEAMVAALLTEKLEGRETLAIIGAERFNNARDKAEQFDYTGDFRESVSEVDSLLRLPSVIMAMDAAACVEPVERAQQFTTEGCLRDVIKAFSAFSVNETYLSRRCEKIATGNWGCAPGSGGAMPLKMLLQWIAASKAGRELVYVTTF
jgi:hypothetical protein